MSWLFSQALVVEYSADTSLDGELSAPSSGNPTQQAYLSHGKTTELSRLSRFGMTCKPLTDSHGAALLMSYLAASHARTSAQPGGGLVSTEPALECGEKWPESSAKYCLESSSWKTAHCLWEEVFPWSSVTLPRWGMTRNGHVYQHPTAERPISATGYGLWPTPTCQDNIQQAGQFTKKTGTTLGFAALYWTTPSATDGQRGGKITEKMTSTILAQQINTPAKWPTPSAMIVDAKSSVVKLSGRTPKDPQIGLADKVMAVEASRRTYPTATATAHKGWHPNHNRASTDDRLDYTIERESFIPGQKTPRMRLNPEWVEWLMGWPLGWTDLKPLAMDKFQEWQRQHSLFLLENKEAA